VVDHRPINPISDRASLTFRPVVRQAILAIWFAVPMGGCGERSATPEATPAADSRAAPVASTRPGDHRTAGRGK